MVFRDSFLNLLNRLRRLDQSRRLLGYLLIVKQLAAVLREN